MNTTQRRKKTYTILALATAIALAFAAGFILRGAHSGTTSGGTETQVAKKVQWWTCSMHPQIKLPKPGKCPLCGMDLIPLQTSAEEEGGLRELAVSENSAKLMGIETTPVERRFVAKEIRMVGKIDYDETRVSYITAWVPGRLDRLFVDYTGVPVKNGDHMVSLYSPELLSAQEELLQAIDATKSLERSDVSIVRDTTEATVAAAREKLRLWGLTPEQIKEIEQRGKPDDHMTIYAPTGGIVVEKRAQEGMYVKTGTRIYTIADLSQIWVHLDAYESDLEWIRYGQPVHFTTEAYPGKMFSGKISFISPVLDESSRTVKIRVNVPNKDGRLKPGMFVRAVVESKLASSGKVMASDLSGKWICPMHADVVKDQAGVCDICGMDLVKAESLGYVAANELEKVKPLVIPASAALLTGTRAIVYVQVPGKKKPTFEGREIVLGPRAGNYYLVKRGLTVGDRVVTKGNFKLDAELQIRAKPSMMTPGGGGGGMAGMHMGKSEPTKKMGEKPPMAGMGISLPAVVQSQMHEVMSAAMAAIGTSPTELDGLHSAYRTLKDHVEAVSSGKLSGHARMQWKEYAMLLGNDGAEGESVKTAAEATRLAATTREHMETMQAKFGLTHGDHAMSASSAVNPEFRKQLATVIDRYMDIQSALAKDDVAKAAAAALNGVAALSGVDMSLVKGQDHMDWMKIQGKLKPLLARLAKAKNIEDDRKEFALLSEEIAALAARFRPMKAATYQFHCPMAFDGRGANWLQDDKDTRNPYFGSAMPMCGDVTDVIPAGANDGGNDHD